MFDWLKNKARAVAAPAPNTAPGSATLASANPYAGTAVLPRLRHHNFVRLLDEQGLPPAQRPLVQPLCADLWVSYAFDLPDGFVQVTPALAAQAELGTDALHSRAMLALDQQVARVGVRLLEEEGVFMVKLGEQGAATQLEAASVLLPGIGDLLQTHAGAGQSVWLAVPTRDHLLAVPADNAAARAHAQGVIEELMGPAEQHALSRQWLCWRDGVLTAVGPQP